MVSLGDDSRRSGGFFFDRNESCHDSEELLAEEGLCSHSEPSFRPMTTPWLIILMMLLAVCQEVTVFLLPQYMECSRPDQGLSAASVLSYSQVALWFVCLLCDRYWRYQHYLSRTAGYLEFYRFTRNIRRLPLMTVSAATAVLLVIVTILYDYCGATKCHGGLTTCQYQQIVVSIQTLILLPALVLYLVRTCQFNQKRAPPDVCQEEFIVSLFQPPAHITDVGCRDEAYVDEVLEKQADMIRYLRQHNINLARRVIQLNTQLRQKDSHA